MKLNENEFASGSYDNTIKIWRKKDNQFELVQTITGHDNRVLTLI